MPFHDVFIHPKILDGYGEGMSKSKGNGVDPIDVIEKFGADSLRFGLAYLTTETQDVRMPVEYECPHCQKLIEQTKQNRTQPTIKCKHCSKEFSTQWAEKPEHKALPRGAVVSERFELSRNFCNKLWNASRFSLMNLDGFDPGRVADDELTVEDSWILSRLNTVTQAVTDALAEYRFADAARVLYDFAWDEFCSFYVEMVKGRLQDDADRAVAQRVLAHTLDTLLRLLHPMIPFLTEDVWQRLGEVAPDRGIDEVTPAAESVMLAPWPECDPMRQDAEIEAQFARFQEVLRAVRDIRARQGVAPKTPLAFAVRCDAAVADLLGPMESYFAPMANARCDGLRPGRDGPGPERQRIALRHGGLRRSGRLDRQARRDCAEEAGGRKARRLHRREGKEADQRQFRRASPRRRGSKGARQPEGAARPTRRCQRSAGAIGDKTK